MSAFVRVEQDGDVATVVLDRPDRRNAMTLDGWTELRTAIDALAVDDSVRAVILTGAGGDFCTGADMGRRATSTRSSGCGRSMQQRSP